MIWLKTLLLPPLANVILAVLGALLWRRMPWVGVPLVVIGLLGLLWLATPAASHWLRQGLEPYPPLRKEDLVRIEAIVILGGGRDFDNPEFGWDDTPSNATWRRLAYGAKLHRDGQWPILVSGGRMHGESMAEAELMARALEDVFSIPVVWREIQSRNTLENARFSADLLRDAGIQRIALVSQAWHLPRAVPVFRQAGLDVVPAPTEFTSPPPAGLRAWLPRAYHLRHSARALEEWLGRAAYALRNRIHR